MAEIVRRDPRANDGVWNPFSLLDEALHMPGMWEDFGQLRRAAADVYETDDEVVVQMAVPGIKPEDINIQISGDTVTVSGETREDKEDKRKNYYQRQLRYGSFSQSVVIPTSVKADNADASFKNGILKLTLPKSEEVKPKTIKVKIDSE